MATYTYIVSLQTMNGLLNEDSLRLEIQAHPTITIALDDVGRSGDLALVVFKAELTEGEHLLLDALVAAHTGEETAKLPQIVQIQATSRAGINLLVHGQGFEAELNTDTVFDIVLTENRELHGAAPCVWNPSAGDWVSLAIVHPQAGVVAEIGRQVYVGSDGKIYPINAEKTKELFAGLIIRLTYHSTATDGLKPYCAVNFMWHRENAI